MKRDADDARGLFDALIAAGLPSLAATALAVLFASGFALFLTLSRQFLAP